MPGFVLKGRRIWIAFTAAALLVMLAAVASPAEAAFPGQNGKIAFVTGGDIWTMNVDGSMRTQLTSGAAEDGVPSWSPDGTKILFHRQGTSLPPQVYVMNANGSGVQQVTNRSGGVGAADWSPDGTRIVYTRCCDVVHTADADGTNEQTLSFSTSPNYYEGYFNPAWKADGTEIAIGGHDCTYHCVIVHFFTIGPDGSGFDVVWGSSFATRHDWSPDGRYLVAPDDQGPSSEGLARIEPHVGTFHITDFGYNAAWSPDGTRILYDCTCDGWSEGFGELFTVSPDGNGQTNITNTPSIYEFSPDWQPIPINGYPRPKGTYPLELSLVPAYQPCTNATANRTHGPPLAFPSCAPPQRAPGQLTVGTADSNQRPTKSVSIIRLRTMVGIPQTPADEADISLSGTVNDVRLASDLSDYTGNLEARIGVRITDKDNTPHPGGPGAATTQDITYSFPIPCSATSDPAIGGDCTFDTTAEAFVPGIAKELRRAVWELGALKVHDGAGNLFMTQGIFVP